MTKYIDADALSRWIKAQCNPYGEPTLNYETSIEILSFIDRMPADVEPPGKWVSVDERLPKPERKYSWEPCLVTVLRSHFPTSSYDPCDAPYTEQLVTTAMYDAIQKIWHLDCDEQLNALMSIDDSPLNGDYVTHWMPLPEPPAMGENTNDT